MQRIHWIIVVGCVLGLLPVAQAQAPQTREDLQQVRQQADQKMCLRKAGMFRAHDLIGMNVRSRDNEDLGEIEDLVIDPKTGQITYAAISSGGFLGLGGRLVAVPFTSLQLRTGEGGESDELFAMLNVRKEAFARAPSFDSDHWPTTPDKIWQVGTEQEPMDVDVEQQNRPVREAQPGHEAQPGPQTNPGQR